MRMPIALLCCLLALVGVPLAAQANGVVNPCAPTNPCAAKNPCAANPCAAKNPCAAAPAVSAEVLTRPAGVAPHAGDPVTLSARGKSLWSDASLGSNGLSCDSCHANNAAFQPSFAQPYPHPVAMASERAGMEQIDLDGMVQMCVMLPMAGKPLAWDSEELAALTAYAGEVQNQFRLAAMNPCAVNPCAVKNPCAVNPCAVKNPCAVNPCAVKNPCAVNPCAVKNPCAVNPCAVKNPCAVNPCAVKNPCAAQNPCKAQ